jgi:hypothetical protein
MTALLIQEIESINPRFRVRRNCFVAYPEFPCQGASMRRKKSSLLLFFLTHPRFILSIRFYPSEDGYSSSCSNCGYKPDLGHDITMEIQYLLTAPHIFLALITVRHTIRCLMMSIMHTRTRVLYSMVRVRRRWHADCSLTPLKEHATQSFMVVVFSPCLNTLS